MVTANRTYKDSLFVDFFKDKARIIELYNAIAGTDYPPSAEIEFAILENVLFKTRCNDLAFMIDDRLIVFLEYQSSINKGMPLRMLLFISDIYRGLLAKELLYGHAQQKIPTPEFFVVYNGKDKYPERMVLRLSDAFKVRPEEPSLELVVPVYNINDGHNEELLKQSTSLSHYATFISLVREAMENEQPPDEAIKTAIHYCIEHDIMKEYLTENSDEVRRMLSMEWDDEVYERVMRAEGHAEGHAESRLEIARRMKEEGISVEIIERVTGLTAEEIAAL